jgi:outer membrane murein-binding lipoprotein Lpp
MCAKGVRMGELEAFGDAVTGGILGRAVEPKAGEAADGHSHEANCLNCGAPLAGPYCHECGQHAHVHRTLSSFFHDFLHGVLHFEGKIWRTLPLLWWKPGELTRRYIDGQRARFVSPIALFLFSVFLMFAVMGLTGGLDAMGSQAAQNDLATEIRDDQSKIAELQADRREAVAEGRSTAKIDSRITEARNELAAIQVVKSGKVPPAIIKADPGDRIPDWLQDIAGNAAKNPELLFYKLKTNAYKFSWALIPISVPFVWLLFPFSRRFRLYDHTVFVTYSLCFMMQLLVLGTVIALVSAALASFAWFLPPVHMYRQLRGTYGVSAIGAVWRTSLLTIFAFVAIGLFASLLVGLGAFD